MLVRGEKFDTVMAAIGCVLLCQLPSSRAGCLTAAFLAVTLQPTARDRSHPGHISVTLELQKCKPLSDAQRAALDKQAAKQQL